jgi:hypothetical protein
VRSKAKPALKRGVGAEETGLTRGRSFCHPAAMLFRCRSNHCIPEKPGLLLVVCRGAQL